MYDYTQSTMPWVLFRDSITSIVINNGCTSIGNYAFDDQIVTVSLSDYATCDSVCFTAVKCEKTEFERKITSLKIDLTRLEDLSDSAAFAMIEPSCAYANVLVDRDTKSDDCIPATIDFYDNNGHHFTKKILLSVADDDSPKNGFSITLCEDEYIGDETTKLTIGNWAQLDEYELKSFYYDGLRGTAEIAYRLYDKMSARGGVCPKAFPCILYINGEYYGIMSWQTAKHGKNMGLDEENSSNVWLDGKLNDKQLFAGRINWEKFAVRNPINLYSMNGREYQVGDPQELMDSTSSAYIGEAKHVLCNEAKKHIVDMANYGIALSQLESDNASVDLLRLAIEERFDVPAMIDYMLFSLITNNYCGFADGWQWFTRDGEKWSLAPSDCDLTFGYNEEGLSLWDASKSSKKYDFRMQNVDTSGPMKWVNKYYWDDVKNRYAQLRRDNMVSPDCIMLIVNAWINRIGEGNYSAEWDKWKCPVSDSKQRIGQWITERISLLDDYMQYYEPCDVNGDGTVDIVDVNCVVSAILMEGQSNNNSNTDLNGDGVVDVCDINVLIRSILRY